MNRTITRFISGAVTLGALLGALPRVLGQAHDATPGVPVRIWGSGYGGANPDPAEVAITCAEDFLPDSSGNPSPLPDGGSRSAGGNDWFHTAVGTVNMEPGKVYHILVDANNAGSVVNSVALNMAPPLGYELEIDYQRRQRADHATSSHQYIVRLMGSREQAFMAAGAGTQLMVGRIYWQVGLGGLRNGKAAGSLSIVDAGASADWSVLYTIAALHYETPSPEITIVPKTGGLMRQIVANQAVLDIVTHDEDAGLSATQYELRFYHPDQASGSGSSVRTFSGNPYLTYRVEQGATSTTLNLTSTTRNTTAANSWTASVVRTAVTTLARVDDSPTGWPTYTWTRNDWNTFGETQVAEQVTASAGTTSDRTDTLAIHPGGGGTNASYHARTYHLFDWGEEITGDTAGSSNSMTTAYDYWTDSAEVGRYGFLKSISTPGGGWESYDYWDATSSVGTKRIGTLRYRYRPFTTAPASVAFNATEGEVTNYDFADDPFGVSTRPTLVETRVNNLLTAKSSTGYSDVSGGSINGATVVEATRYDYSASGSYLTTITRFYKEDTANLFLRNQVHSVTRPDNVKVSFAYQQGLWNGSAFDKSANNGLAVGLASRIATITGIVGTGYSDYDGWSIDELSLVSGKSTLEVVIRDSRALVVRTEAHVWISSAWQQVASVNYVYDTMGRLISRTASNGAIYEAHYNGEQKDYDIDESGVRTDYGYDHAGRISQVKKQNAANSAFTTIVTYAYDSAGRVKTETVSGTGATETVVNARNFDTAGRLDDETPAGSSLIDHSYNVANRTHTVTTVDNVARTQTYHRDGRLEKVEGDGIVPAYYTYSVADPTGQRITEVHSGTSTSPRYRKAWSDWLGRPIKSENPGFSQSSQDASIVENFYDDTTIGKGRLYKTTRTGYKPLYFYYDSLGLLTQSGLDMDTTSNGLQGSSDDRITERNQYVEPDSGTYWLRTDTRVYFPGSSSATTTSISRLRLTGHSGIISESRQWDVEDSGSGDTSTATPTVTSTVAVNRSTKTVTTTTTTAGVPDSETATIVNGLATTFLASDGLTYTSEYDALERLSKELAPRQAASGGTGHKTVYAYKDGTGMIESVTDPAGKTLASTHYDDLGRVSWTTNAETKYTRFAYNDRGQITRQWGDGTYPVEYGYNSYGDRISQSTFRGAPASDDTSWPSVGDPDTTTLDIDAATGLLWKKTDALGKIVEFDYNVRGQTASRKWARHLNPDDTNTDKVTTSYDYVAGTGELWKVIYNDDALTIPTPDITYTYDRLGRVLTVDEKATEGGVGERAFSYDSAKPWRLKDETLPTFFGSRVLTRLYDESTSSSPATLKGRSRGFELGIAGTGNTDRDLVHAWTFTNSSRFAAVKAKLGTGSEESFTYAYEDNSTLLDGYTRGSFTVSRDYEDDRDLVTRLESKYGTGSGSTRTRFDYTYDDVGRRKTAKQSGTAYADYTAGQSYGAVYHRYTYNARGELLTAAMYGGDDPTATTNELPGRRVEYRFDSIGNRKSSGATGSSTGTLGDSGSGDDDYEVNALNQVKKRENNRVDVTGTTNRADPSTNVAVVGTMSTTRVDRAWANTLEPDNVSGPAVGRVTAYAATTSGTLLVNKATGIWVAPKRQQQLTYDLDGNLTGDGLWTYTYNAENRLVRASQAPLAANFGSSFEYYRKLIDFKYDYAGRRIAKSIVYMDTESPTPPTLVNRRFVYDGWNLIAELNNLDGTSSAILRSYTWGLDNVGSLTSSSAPGSLLRITNYSGGTPATNGSYYPTYDDQGNVASLVKASDGSLAAVYEYDPSGNLIRNEVIDSAIADNPFRHATKYHDLETGLVYYGYRYYSPTLGRFINQDPSGEVGGLNLYGFCGNGGVNGSDYLGLWMELDGLDMTDADVRNFYKLYSVQGRPPSTIFDAISSGYFRGLPPEIWAGVNGQPGTTYVRNNLPGPQPPVVVPPKVEPPEVKPPDDKPPVVVLPPTVPPPLVPTVPPPSTAPQVVDIVSGTDVDRGPSALNNILSGLWSGSAKGVISTVELLKQVAVSQIPGVRLAEILAPDSAPVQLNRALDAEAANMKRQVERNIVGLTGADNETSYVFAGSDVLGEFGSGSLFGAEFMNGLKSAAQVLDQAAAAVENVATKVRNPHGSRGKPDHQAKIRELEGQATGELRPGERVLSEKKIQGYDSNRRPDVQIVDESGKARKIYEAERHPTSKRNRLREEEYDRLGVEHETYPLR